MFYVLTELCSKELNHGDMDDFVSQHFDHDRTSGVVSSSSFNTSSVPQLPGFWFDPITCKYYKIQPNGPGQPQGSTKREIEMRKNRYDYERFIEQDGMFHQNGELSKTSGATSTASLPSMLSKLSLGQCRVSATKRYIEEKRLRKIRQMPSYSFEVTDNLTDKFFGCQFLDVKQDGRTLIGCWKEHSNCGSSRVITYDISVDSSEAQKHSKLLDSGGRQLTNTNGRQHALNTYGLRFEQCENNIFVDWTLVDMLMAPADSDVTCILYATANSFYSTSRNGCGVPKLVTYCQVFLKPVNQLTKEEGKDSMSSPIYNAEWKSYEPIWSCAFDSNHMRIGIGMEKYAEVFNVLTLNSFRVSSGGKNVIAQQYSKEGDILYLGRRNANMSSLDLRMSNNHMIGEFADSKSTSYIYQMVNRPHQILTDNFGGTIKQWDSRMRRCVLSFDEHQNKSHKVPCFVDENEQFIFAVGEDGVTRGWSLSGCGELLCSIRCPVSAHQNHDFPRIAYSDRWGGVSGNSALLLAVDGDIYVHELLI